MSEQCRSCGESVVNGQKTMEGIFCSPKCHDDFHTRGFCEKCVGETIAVRSGNDHTINGIGTSFYGESNVCPVCGSVLRRLFGCVFFIPIVPLGRFRVKYVTSTRFLSRRVRKPGEADAISDLDDEGYELLQVATNLEVAGRLQDALKAYSFIAEKYPNTSAGRDAQKSIDSLRALTGNNDTSSR